MRIAIVTPGFSASEDDPCIPVLLDRLHALAATDDVVVFPLRYPHHRTPYAVHGARVVPLGGATVRGPARAGLYRRALAAIRREDRRAPFDLIHAHWAHEPGFVAVTAARRLGVPSVVSLMGGELVALPAIDYGGRLRLANRLLTGHALARATRVLAVSRHQAELAAPFVESGRLGTLPPGVCTRRFAPGPGEGDRDGPGLEGEPRLLFVGALVPVKDPGSALATFATVAARHPRAHLHLVGEGPLGGALERQARALGVADRVHLRGAVDHISMPALYRDADLLVCSSLSESGPQVALEALACGCPVVGTAVGLLPELPTAAPTVPPGDPDALAGAVHSALADRDALCRRGAEGAAWVRDGRGLDASVRLHRELYAALIG